MHIVTQLSKPKRFALQLHFHALPPRHKKERSTLRAVQFYTCLPACPQTQIVLLWRKDQNIQINNLQPSKGCTHMLGFKALTLGRGSRHFGEMFYSRLLHPALRPTKSGQQYWRLHLVKSCQGPHTFSRFIHFFSEEKMHRMRSLSIINVLETRSRERNNFLTSAPKGNLS